MEVMVPLATTALRNVRCTPPDALQVAASRGRAAVAKFTRAQRSALPGFSDKPLTMLTEIKIARKEDSINGADLVIRLLQTAAIVEIITRTIAGSTICSE